MKILIGGDMEYCFSGDEAMGSTKVIIEIDNDTYKKDYLAIRIQGAGLPNDHVISVERKDMKLLNGFLKLIEE
jgi:hypothetical protein